MLSIALYTDIGRVAQALAMQSPENLSSNVSVGALSITLNQTPPPDWTIGSIIIIDFNNPQLRESIQITGISGVIISFSSPGLINNHLQNAPLVNGTILSNYIGAASRMFDSMTWCSAGFAYETVTDTKDGHVTNKGYISIPLSKPIVALSDVTSATFQCTPMDSIDALNLGYARIRNNYFLEVVAPRNYSDNVGMATVTYKGGYNPLPDDLTMAVTMLAARLYKERDSGYSDTIGSAETGIFQYKKAIPADIQAVVQKYRRWTV